MQITYFLIQKNPIIYAMQRCHKSDQPRPSHIYTNFSWLRYRKYNTTLMINGEIAPVVQRRFNKLYHLLMTIAFFG